MTNQEEQVKQQAKGFLQSILVFLKELLDIRTNTDMQATRDSIIADIPFKGHTSWILISSIFIASIGLNANSTAVVIGAMLISPLMGPILGLGFSLATNDIDLLKRSLKNFW
jgi:Predicted membrane protein